MANWNYSGWHIGSLPIALPVVQGGMGIGVSLANLASAVANEGGIGVISSVGIGMLSRGFSKYDINSDAEALRREIRKARSMTKGVLGVNIMVALSGFSEMVKASIEEGIDVIFSGAGLPLNLPGFLPKGCRTKLVPIVSSAKAVNVITKWWKEKYNYIPDAFVVEGPMAGGHLGFKKDQIDDPKYKLENIVTEVLKQVDVIEEKEGKKIPIIAAGGIFTGEDIYKFLKLGAASVQMATRFVTTEECDVDIEFKKAYVNCKKEDIGIIESPVGMPGRAIVNTYIKQSKAGEKSPRGCPYHCIITCKRQSSPYCISLALINACKGNLNDGFAFIGANGYRINEIVTVKQLFELLGQEYNAAMELENKV